MRTIEERYRTDPAFATLVNTLYGFMEKCEFTPTEIREAAMLAQINLESRSPRLTAFSNDLVREIEMRSNLRKVY